MTISHRTNVTAAAQKSMKVARMACCCRLADLLPMVQQLHQQAAHAGSAAKQEQQRSEAA